MSKIITFLHLSWFFQNVRGKQAEGVGTAVLDLGKLLGLMTQDYFSNNAVEGEEEGQYLLVLPAEANSLVSSGEGLLEGKSQEDFHARFHRGEWSAYLKREFALPVKSVTVVIYSLEACKNDGWAEEEVAEMERLGHTHSLVTVLATSQDEFKTPPKTPTTFVRNLAGENQLELGMTGDEIRTEAKQIDDHWLKWAVVSD